MQLQPADTLFIARLTQAFPENIIRQAEPRYLEEPRGSWQGIAGCVALPTSTEKVATILRIANEACVPVVPYGGGTGLVGGQVYPEGPAPVVLSLERMNKVLDANPAENVLVTQAGATLDSLHKAADNIDRLFPLAIASSGTAQIGGNLATNAGGSNVLRYGNTRDLCLGLEVVLPDGRIWNGLSRLRKDNTGYDLRDIFVGSEGTLGVITAASLKLFPRPSHYATALLVVPSPLAALDLLALVRSKVGESVSAFELIHGNGYAFLRETMPDFKLPFDTPPQWSVLLDLGLSEGMNPDDTLEGIFTDAYDAGLVTDGLLAASLTQRDEFWALRETIPLANRAVGAIASHDVSLPISRIPSFIEQADKALAALADMRINCFGHLGDGNLHYNVFPPVGKTKQDYQPIREKVSEVVHDLVHQLDGSFSAEHGVGRLKTHDLMRYGDPVKLTLMKGVKQQFDPNGIMNPGAIFQNEAEFLI